MTSVHSRAADPFEQASYGGASSPLLDQTLLTQRIAMPVLPTGTSVAPEAVALRLAVPIGALQAYLWTAHASGCAAVGPACMQWNRVLGAECAASLPAVPFAGTPPVRALLGVGRSLDAPLRHEIRGYVSVIVDP